MREHTLTHLLSCKGIAVADPRCSCSGRPQGGTKQCNERCVRPRLWFSAELPSRSARSAVFQHTSVEQYLNRNDAQACNYPSLMYQRAYITDTPRCGGASLHHRMVINAFCICKLSKTLNYRECTLEYTHIHGKRGSQIHSWFLSAAVGRPTARESN